MNTILHYLLSGSNRNIYQFIFNFKAQNIHILNGIKSIYGILHWTHFYDKLMKNIFKKNVWITHRQILFGLYTKWNII